MPYADLLRQSLHIAWRNRWLWLLALFAGEAGGGGGSGGFGGNQRKSAQQDANDSHWIHSPYLFGINFCTRQFLISAT